MANRLGGIPRESQGGQYPADPTQLNKEKGIGHYVIKTEVKSLECSQPKGW